MSATSTKAAIREMDAEELQEHANELFTKCQGNILILSDNDHDELKECANNYYHLTGETLQPKLVSKKYF